LPGQTRNIVSVDDEPSPQPPAPTLMVVPAVQLAQPPAYQSHVRVMLVSCVVHASVFHHLALSRPSITCDDARRMPTVGLATGTLSQLLSEKPQTAPVEPWPSVPWPSVPWPSVPWPSVPWPSVPADWSSPYGCCALH